ncbi:MAG: hypothetical protein AUG49_25360 [Catenulispora sp. 13_1_20CM_3_70_7]|nr:MAG: hypothetical protein AUG49_25360 [Catenulispora sp. 13_1_20CM_3_70_7]
MSVPRTSGGLSTYQASVLAAIYTHRIVPTSQLRTWLDPNHEHNDGRTMQKNLAALRTRGLIDVLSHRRRSERLWFATRAGAAAAEASHLVVPRTWRMTPDKLQKGVNPDHTVATNEAATILRAAALAAGHECGPLDWSNEVPHRWGKAGTNEGRRSVIADAVMRTTVTARSRDYGVPDERFERVQFIEMDRGTMQLSRLVDKLRAYGHYRQNGQKHWLEVYGWDFPALLVVLDGLEAPGLNQRRADLIAAVQRRRLLETGKTTEPWMAAAVVTLAELRDGQEPVVITDPHPNRRGW